MRRVNAAAQPDRSYANGREQYTMPNHHGPEGMGLGSKRDANADFARPLRYGIRDDAVDSDHAEQQRHAARDGEHHQREGASRHRFAVNLFHGANASERQIRIDGPYRLPDFFDKTFGAGAGAADCENRASLTTVGWL